MKMSDRYVNEQLDKAQKLLWGGSETENIEAHNIIAKLIKDREDLIENSQGRSSAVTTQLNIGWDYLQIRKQLI